MQERKGRFIVFEGIDGSGITTQANKIRNWFYKNGQQIFLAKEPSEGPAGIHIRLALARRLVSPRAENKFEPLTEETLALLFAADRMDHLSTDIIPKLQNGVNVVCDRYYLSSYAYQSLNLDINWIKAINAKAINPDITIFLDVPVTIAKKRMDQQRWHVELYEEISILERIRENYLNLIKKLQTEGHTIEIVDGNMPIPDVFNNIKKIIKKNIFNSKKKNNATLSANQLNLINISE